MTIKKEWMGTVVIGAVVLAVLLNLGSICQGSKITQNTVSIKDMLNRTVKIPEKVNRVVGIEAGALRLLVYLECTDKIVGVEDIEQRSGGPGCDKPYNFAYPEFASLPVIGPIHGGDAELIVAQEPDVIFWTYTTVGDADKLQEKTGIPVVALNYGDLDDNRDTFYENLRLVGKVLDK